MSRPASMPATAAHWGAYRVDVHEGRVRALLPIEGDRDPSPIAEGMVDTLDDPCRIPQPMVRRAYLEGGPATARERRGAEPFVAVSWQEAERLVAAEIDRVRARHGNSAIFAGSYGWGSAGQFHHAQGHAWRLLNLVGGYSASVNTYSTAAADVIVTRVVANFHWLLGQHTAWPSLVRHCDLIVSFGGLPLKNSQVSFRGLGRHVQREHMQAAARSGVRFVNVSPIRGDVDEALGAQWLAAVPNTDTALMLGLAHTLVVEDLHDRDFLDRYCVGFERFAPYLLGERDGTPKDAEWAARLSGIEAEVIRDLARRMASGRTLINISWSLSRQDHGEQPFWMGITLAAMLGQIGLPGGGVGLGYACTNGVGQHATRLRWGSLNPGRNPVDTFIPVARIADMLLNPGEPYDYNGERRRYPDVRLVYWLGGNPFHHHQDLNRLLRAWQRPETIVVHEPWWTPLARHADIVLPATTPLERNDIVTAALDPQANAAHQCVEPYAEARNDFDILAGVARVLGVESEFTEGRDEMQWLRHLHDVSRQRAAEQGIEMPTFDAFWAEGKYRLPEPATPQVMLSDFRADPQANPLRTPSGKIEVFSATIDGFGYDDCLGHPAWFEPAEWLGAAQATHFPLHLVSNQPATRLHGQLDNGAHSRAGKLKGREPMRMHPQDASARGIAEGDLVRVFNRRGACLSVVVVSDEVRPRVVQLPTGAWFDPAEPGVADSLCKHGNPNVLTLDKGTSKLAQGPSAHTCLVEVERYEGEPPPVTAFDPPEIVERS